MNRLGEIARFVGGVIVLVLLIIGVVVAVANFDPSAAVECRGPVEQYCPENQ